jgi:ribosomal-protein-alanine N-acetyltransferase
MAARADERPGHTLERQLAATDRAGEHRCSHCEIMVPPSVDSAMSMALLDRFTTRRLRAERLTADHLDEIVRMHADPVVMARLGGVRDAAASMAYFERNLNHWREHGFGLWIVYEREGREPIGRAMLRWLRVGDVDEVEIGYAFYEPYWRRGLASETTLACIDLARRELRRTSLVAVTSPDNLASQRVLTKAGFVYEREFPVEGTVCRLFRHRVADM